MEMNMKLKHKRVVVIGGSAGIGLEIAKQASFEGADVIIASRSNDKLTAARSQFEQPITTKQIDCRHESALQNFFSDIGKIDHLVITAAEVSTARFESMPMTDAKSIFESKFWGTYQSVKQASPFIKKTGSVIMFSGRLSQRPSNNGTVLLSAVNSAIEGLGRALALELSPIRVNVISPGLTRTSLHTNLSSDEFNEKFKTTCDQFVIKRAAEVHEIALAALYLMQSTYTTGSTLFNDGGYTFR